MKTYYETLQGNAYIEKKPALKVRGKTTSWTKGILLGKALFIAFWILVLALSQGG